MTNTTNDLKKQLLAAKYSYSYLSYILEPTDKDTKSALKLEAHIKDLQLQLNAARAIERKAE